MSPSDSSPEARPRSGPAPGPAATTSWGATPGGHDAAWADLDRLVTGEGVALELPPASAGLRVVSGLVDLVVQVVVLVVGLFVAGLLATSEALAAAYGVVAVVGALVVAPTVLETLTGGRTLGKLALGLRTVRDDAGPVSFHHVFVRHLVGVVELWLLVGVPALAAALVTTRGKRLGDLVAGTYVVRDRVRLSLPWPVPMPPPLAAWAAGADIAPLPDRLALTVRRVLARGGTLHPEARRALTERTAAQVARHVAPPPPPGTPPEAFLAAVSAERRSRDEVRLRREAELRHRLTARRP
ncbi:Uncharacterized membrane protein YckC, RDD family [Nocardioides scoriae]|uniref:Uncharacterized membrane protein YckC, RDD family n=1 Tax=Nocardioides scoriae TaxID=642780 RepID=A0A1H1TC01_9ACTN|nr:RDD family protein [Nocardioides scoriae]SDS57601.1 Uncharacterized membrane protein YckC, RDD family [Nocardioides scoriae]